MRLIGLFFVSAFIASAQFADGIATSVNRTVTLTPDEADFAVVAAAGLDVTPQQVTQVFLDAGIASLSLTGTALVQAYDYSTNPPATRTQVLYQFAFTVPAPGLKDATNKLEGLRASPPSSLMSMQYTASLNASQATVDAMRLTLLPQLLADAQKKAQTLAAAAGLKLGAVKGVTESFYGSGSSVASWIGTSQFVGGFSSSSSGTGTQYTFYASVNFTVAAQ